MTMKYSRDGLELTKSFEQCRLTPYQDSAGVWTNGWGNTHGVVPGQVISQFKADADLLVNVQTAVDVVNRLVTVPLSQHNFDALVDFTFNAGEGNFAKSTMLRYLNAGNFMAAELEFAKWTFAGGAHLAGLAHRRAAENALFDLPDNEGI